MMIYILKMVAIVAIYGLVLCFAYVMIKIADEIKKQDRKDGLR